MFTTTEEEFIELKYDIKENLEKVKSKLKNIDVEIKDITVRETILLIKDNLLGIEFNLAIDNYFAKKEEPVIEIIMNHLINRIQKNYIKE